MGFNGSGKSTILKLVARIYDVTEGTIRINGRNIRDLKLDDLRRSIAVLFQDYTLFPVSVSSGFHDRDCYVVSLNKQNLR